MTNYDPKDWGRFWQKTKEDQNKADKERQEAAENARVEKIVSAIDRLAEQQRGQPQETPAKRERVSGWKIAEVFGLWAAAAVGLTAIIVANNDAGSQLTTMNNQATAMQGQLNEMKTAGEQTGKLVAANEKVANATLSAGRAWVGTLYAIVVNVKASEGVKIDIVYGNTGREPALTNIVTEPKIFNKRDWDGGVAVADIVQWENACLLTPLNEFAAQVVFPTTGPTSLVAHFNSANEYVPDNLKYNASNELVAGDEFLAIKGCFTYKSVATIHHTSFCYSYNAKSVVAGQLSICTVGHRAD